MQMILPFFLPLPAGGELMWAGDLACPPQGFIPIPSSVIVTEAVQQVTGNEDMNGQRQQSLD